MRNVIVPVYKFSELSDTAKAKARDWYRQGFFEDNSWSEFTIDEAKTQGELLGIDFDTRGSRPVVCIWWSGFWSQGDGACFEGTWRASAVKADEVAKDWGDSSATTEIKRIAAEFARIAAAYPECSFSVKHRGSYSHENCTEFDFEFPDADDGTDWPEEKREEYNRECENLKTAAKGFMRWIYRQLEAEWNERTSEDAITEDIENRDYEFKEDGTIFH